MMSDNKTTREENYVRFCPLDEDNRQRLLEMIKSVSETTNGFAPSLNKVVNDILREVDVKRVQLHYVSQIQQGTLQTDNLINDNNQ